MRLEWRLRCLIDKRVPSASILGASELLTRALGVFRSRNRYIIPGIGVV